MQFIAKQTVYSDQSLHVLLLLMMTGDDNTSTDDSAAAAAHAHAQLAPLFLLPVLPDVIMAGKSMHMLQRLDRTQQVHPGRSLVRSIDPSFARRLDKQTTSIF